MPSSQSSNVLSTSVVLQAQAGDQQALAQVLAATERVVRHVANRMGRVSTSKEDLIQAGTIGVLEALKSFDPGGGASIVTYSKSFIFDEVSKAVGNGRQGFNVPNSTAKRYWRCVNASDSLDGAIALYEAEGGTREAFFAAHHALTGVTSLDSAFAEGDDEDEGSYEVEALDGEFASSLTEALAAKALLAQGFAVLEAREREVLEMAFGLNGHPNDLTDGAIAAALGVDRSRIVRIRNRALNKVRESLTDANKEG